MVNSQNWSTPNDDEYTDDDGNVVYYDRQGKLKRYKSSDLEFQQMYHYQENDN